MKEKALEDNAGDARLLREMSSKEKPGSFELTHPLRMSYAMLIWRNAEWNRRSRQAVGAWLHSGKLQKCLEERKPPRGLSHQ
jgi:hypothetical protein